MPVNPCGGPRLPTAFLWGRAKTLPGGRSEARPVQSSLGLALNWAEGLQRVFVGPRENTKLGNRGHEAAALVAAEQL